MKKIFLLFFILFIPNAIFANELYETTIDGYKIKSLKLVKNTGYKLIVGVSEKGESLESIVTRYGGVSGVNGAYFCPADYKECNGINKTWADRISNSNNWSATPDDTGPERVIFALDKNQTPFLTRRAHDYSTGSNTSYIIGKTLNFEKFKDIYNGIGNHPLLLQDGINKLSESNAIDNKMKSKSLKNFICSSQDGNTIFVGGIENINIYEVPEILKKLGCYNAINLDAGGSSAMMHNNKYIRGPGRNIMDAWIIIPDKNYPIKPTVTSNPEIQKILESFKNILNKKYITLDDVTRKQKLFALSSKLNVIINKLNDSNSKKQLYIALKNQVDIMIQ